jgi:hypothetical protein
MHEGENSTEISPAIDVTSSMFDYPKPLSTDQIKDETARGIAITNVNDGINHVYKALLTPLPAGNYLFRAVLTLGSGKQIDQQSDAITLY